MKGNIFTSSGDEDMDNFGRPLLLLSNIGINFEYGKIERNPLWLGSVSKVLQVMKKSLDFFLNAMRIY